MSELYELPDGWEWKKLDEITDVITKGTTPTTNGYKFLDEGINFLKIENIVNGEINLKTIDKFISEEAHTSQKRSQLRINDVLFSIAGTIGDTAIVKEEHLPMNTNQAIAIIRPKEELNSLFLKYSLLSIVSESTKNKQRGGAIKNISLGDIKETIYPLPSLKEQKRIVSKLDTLFEKIDKAIELHEKNIKEADAFMGSVLNEVFEELEEKYEKEKLYNLVKIIGGGTPSKKEDSYWKDGTIKWASVRDMKEDIINSTEFSITEKGLKESSSNLITKDGIIIATRVGLGKVCYINENMAINQDLKGLIPFLDRLDKRYLFNFFKSIEKYIISNGTGATVKGVKLDFIKDINIPLPPLNVQQKTVNYLDEVSQKIEKTKAMQKEKLQNLKDLKASILDQAFKGQL